MKYDWDAIMRELEERQRREERQERESRYPPFWDPEKEGDRLAGVVMDVRTDQFGNPCMDVQEFESGKVFTTRSHASLSRQIKQLNISPGDAVLIVYKGTGKAGKGRNPPRIYSVSKISSDELSRFRK